MGELHLGHFRQVSGGAQVAFQIGCCHFDVRISGWVSNRIDINTLADLMSLGYFIKYLDQININNAFVSGMYVSLGSR